ncbi:unnamed protein product [Fraxinus pennsylvanica]|uniref:Scarecrow-like protein 13 n=1 Tax=Fraxinus pennsylvanica TaxID=56036 RepID=A0AAD2AHP1_9LAMI|nr:unnamed protein product [Fraxinus pennsylvanica]
MQASRDPQPSDGIHSLHHQPMQQIEPRYFSSFQVLNSNLTGNRSQGTEVSFQTYAEKFFTLESTPATDYNSLSAINVSPNWSPFSLQCSQSHVSDLHHSSDNIYGSPLSGFSGVHGEDKLMHALMVLRYELLGPESDIDDSCSFNGVVSQPSSLTRYNKTLETAHSMDLKQHLISCAKAVSEDDKLTADVLMNILETKVSVSGEPLQRLSAYMLEGLRARFLLSGSNIYRKLKCNEPTSSELMSYMHVLYQICPYYKFAYISANVVIGKAMKNEKRIHIIDFQIAQGSQWVSLIQALACRTGGPPYIRVTGVDDSQSAHARGGGLQLVGQRLAKVAEACGVPFEFHAASMSGCEVQLEHLQIRPGEALAVNFPYMLHHMPDESVSTANHRDCLLRLVKSLSPKVVTVVEQESNTNTAPFFQRFCETLDYYTAMFESIDAARPRGDRQRISAEEHCVARDIVNIIACEETERVERHELFGKWSLRLKMAGFSPIPLNSSVSNAIQDMLNEYSSNYLLREENGALYLRWKNRALVTSSAWR